MSLTQELKERHAGLWQKMVSHPFIEEMGDGTLSRERARRYFLQDYVFVNDLVAMIAHGTAKAPSVEAASHLYGFLSVILSPESADENDFFMRAFDILGASEEDYSSATASPVTRAFGDFLVRTGLGGTFEEVVAVCYVTEGTYLDWGTRFLNEGKSPSNPIYREWIELHGPDYLGDFVNWCEGIVNNADDGGERRARIERVFHAALRYEYLFWEAAYNGDSWPDD